MDQESLQREHNNEINKLMKELKCTLDKILDVSARISSGKMDKFIIAKALRRVKRNINEKTY